MMKFLILLPGALGFFRTTPYAQENSAPYSVINVAFENAAPDALESRRDAEEMYYV